MQKTGEGSLERGRIEEVGFVIVECEYMNFPSRICNSKHSLAYFTSMPSLAAAGWKSRFGDNRLYLSRFSSSGEEAYAWASCFIPSREKIEERRAEINIYLQEPSSIVLRGRNFGRWLTHVCPRAKLKPFQYLQFDIDINKFLATVLLRSLGI
jgi:hypothetical protein